MQAGQEPLSSASSPLRASRVSAAALRSRRRRLRPAAPFDITGQWVAVVNEDWRYRMTVPPKGDYVGVPLNPNGRRVADAWDPARDEAAGEQCRAYGVAGLMRLPTRVRISWPDDQSIKIESDAGTQTRTVVFGSAARTRRRLAGRLRGQLGSLGCRDRRRVLSERRWTRWLAQGRDDAHEAGIPAQERRALQRRRPSSRSTSIASTSPAATRCWSCRPRSSIRRTSRSPTGRAAISRSRATLQDGIPHHAP